MPLHPQVKAVLDQITAMGLPELWSLSVQDARAQYAQSRMLAPDEPVARVDDLAIPGPAGDNPAPPYAPRADPQQTVVGYFPRGGWGIGNNDTPHDLWRLMAKGADRTP